VEYASGVLLKRRKSEISASPAPSEHWKLHGDRDPEVMAGGHSHVGCLVGAHDAGLGPQSLRAAVAYPADPGHIDDDYWDFLADGAAGRTVALVWGGNQYNSAFLIRPDRPFRVYRSPEEPQEEPGTWISREMVSGYWAPSFDELARVLGRLVPRSRVLVIGTPPPKRQAVIAAELEGKLDWDPWIAEIASERKLSSSELPISPEPLRLALWSVIQDRMREEARRSGATFVPVPDGACDPTGTLAEAYSAGDLTHANSEYGGLIWAQIEAAVQRNREP
jgi:hypothetical protein